MQVSVLGFGGAEIGYNPDQTQEEVDLLLNSALDARMNVIDTSSSYHNSEELIGRSVAHRRDEYYLLTKAGNLDPYGKSDWSSDGILSSVERSLRRLRTDRLDIVQLHSCDAETLRRGDAIDGLQRAREKGYTRYIGYSGDNDAAELAVDLGVFDSLQTSVSIADQAAIETVIPRAVGAGLGVIAKRPIANAVWRFAEFPESPYYHEYWNRLEKLDYEFLRRPLDESVGIALRFTLAVPGVSTAIVGTTQSSRWQQNAKYARLGTLDEAEFRSIRQRWNEVADTSWSQEI